MQGADDVDTAWQLTYTAMGVVTVGYEVARRRLVEVLTQKGVKQSRVQAAFAAVPRHEFVLPELRHKAYDDCALPIPAGQTISQPYVVALMVSALNLEPTHRVLEIGTGSGYGTAILAELASLVFSVERISALADDARQRLLALGYENVRLRVGDGREGWAEEAPYDGIVVSAAADEPPPALLEQLGMRGRLVIPVAAGAEQTLFVFTRTRRGVRQEKVVECGFVPCITGTE